MRVLLADSHNQVRSALRLLLEQEGTITVIGEVDDAERLLDAIDDKHPDVVLLDWELLGMQPELRLASLRRLWPALALVVLSSRPEARHLAAESGVEFYVSKSCFAEDLLGTLHAAGDQGQLLPSKADHDSEIKRDGI